jgi:hypothetical protein
VSNAAASTTISSRVLLLCRPLAISYVPVFISTQ